MYSSIYSYTDIEKVLRIPYRSNNTSTVLVYYLEVLCIW